MPIYGSGDPAADSLVRDPNTNDKITLLIITILNATGIESKVIAAFVMILIFYTVGTFIFIFFYWKRSLTWRF